MGVSFITTLTKAENLNATGIEVPPEIMAALTSQKKPPVTVNLAGYTYRSTVAVMGGKFMIPLNQVHREAAGVTVGEEIEVTLELDLTPRTINVPADLDNALAAKEGAKAAFAVLAFSKRKEFVRQVEDAKSSETRARRIAGIVAQMSSS